MGPIDDGELLRAIGRDPESGIARVMRRYGLSLLGRLRRRASVLRLTDSDAEEVFLDAVMRLVDPRWRTACMAAGGQILPWLTRWGYWAMASRARDEASRLAAHEEAARSAAPYPSDISDNSQDDRAETARMDDLRRAFSRLSPVDQAVLRWSFAENVSAGEIGRRLGVSDGAARKRAFDARSRLRRHLEGLGWAANE
jgi:RNA polymerase sigma factor (sigma-70 family)